MLKKNLRLLSIFNFLMEFSLYSPVAILYFSRVSGTYALGGSVLGIVMLASSIFEVPTGIWSDRVGRRRTIIAGSWARVLGVIAYAIGLSYSWLVLGAIFEGLSRALYSGNNDALLHDTLEDNGRSADYRHHLGRVTSMEHLAVGVGSLIGGIVASYSFTLLFWLSVLPQLLKLVISYQFVEPRRRESVNPNIYAHTLDAIKLFVKNKKLRLLSIADTIHVATGEVSFQFRATFIESLWPLWAIGALGTAANGLAALSFYFSEKIIKPFGAEKLLLIRSLFGKFMTFVALIHPTVISPALFISPSVIFGAGQVAKNELMQREFTSHQRATMSSLNSLAGSLGFAIMSVVVGLFADLTTPATALLILLVISLPILPIYYKIFKSR